MSYASIDSYSRTPYGCRFCGAEKRIHAWRGWCLSPDRRWVAPHDWLILTRMRLRRTDPARWLPNDYRTSYRKWM